MREVKFRGKSIADSISHRCKKDEWVYGSALHSSFSKSKSYIVQLVPEMFYNVQLRFQSILVKRETIGQFTGLKDKNEKESFADDIIKTSAGKAIICFGEYSQPTAVEKHIGFYLQFLDKSDNQVYRKDLGYWLPESEVVGNIHDNSELMS